MDKIVLATEDELKEFLRSVLAEDRQKQNIAKNKGNPNIDDLTFMNTECTMQFLQIRSRETLYNLIKKQGLPYIKLGRKLLFSKHDLIIHLKQKTKKI